MGDIVPCLPMGIMQHKRKNGDESGDNFKSNILSQKVNVGLSAPVGVLTL